MGFFESAILEKHEEATKAVEGWYLEFERAVAARDKDATRALFHADAYWRDVIAFTWDWGWIGGPDAIADRILGAAEEIAPHDFHIDERRTRPIWIQRGEGNVIEGFLQFETTYGHAEAVVRLAKDGDGYSAITLFTYLRELRGHEVATLRPSGIGVDRNDTTKSWRDHREAALASYSERDPEVLVVGGGHSGLMMASRLASVGVDALIVERNARIGDNWRDRYESLALHTLTDLSHFPDMDYPLTFPSYIPKDKLGDWLEYYAKSMEVNARTSTEFLGGTYDDATAEWTVTLRAEDGTEQVMHPKHVVIATGGISGTPNKPNIPGLEAYTGNVIHSETFKSGRDFVGQKVLIIGMGTSAFDIAFDLYNHGAEPTMLQRSATMYTHVDTSSAVYGAFLDRSRSTEEKDLVSYSDFVYPRMLDGLKAATAAAAESEGAMIEKLRKAGLKIDFGEDGTGYLMRSLRRGGPYYLDVGAGDVIAAGKIRIVQTDEVDGFVENGLKRSSGEVLEFDTVILCTGYLNLKEDVRMFFGDEVAERVGEITGMDIQGEIRNAWRRTAQPGLWFITGGFGQGRPHSVPLALLIQAELEGLQPTTREGFSARPDEVIHYLEN
ncbi:MAG: monooxygenase [Microbacteriaceae bacterium]|nr:monooxygenase [Microbacteriaceae bacterium]